MNKISVVMPVLNEETLIGACVANIIDHVDEIIIIDGGPSGPSTDSTREIVESYEDKVIYKSGTYKTASGAWDSNTQKNQGLSETSGDVVVFYSADMFLDNPKAIFDVIRNDDDFLVYFCPTIEFWIDTNFLRLYSQSNLLSIPSSVLEVLAVKKSISPIFDGFSLHTKDASIEDRLLMPTINKYHLGWIRPFRQQMEKHVRNVKQGRWGKHGEDLLLSGNQKLEQWVISHVLTYKQVGHVACSLEIPEILKQFSTMNYNVGLDEIIDEYKSKYGSAPFRAV